MAEGNPTGLGGGTGAAAGSAGSTPPTGGTGTTGSPGSAGASGAPGEPGNGGQPEDLAGLDLSAAEIAEMTSRLEEEDHPAKGIDLNSLPEEALRVIAEMRKDYTRKTQALAEERKQLQAMRERYVKEAFGHLDPTTDWAKQMLGEDDGGQGGGSGEPDDTLEFDPLDPASVRAYVAKLAEQKAREIYAQGLKEARERQLQEQAKHEAQEFIQRHPDVLEMKEELAAYLRDHPTADAESAYWAVKGPKVAAERERAAKELEEARKRAQMAGLSLGGSSMTPEDIHPPKSLTDPVDIMNWHRARLARG